MFQDVITYLLLSFRVVYLDVLNYFPYLLLLCVYLPYVYFDKFLSNNFSDPVDYEFK